MSAVRLILVRHGVTEWNQEGRFQGHLDPPLSDAGRREAALAGERLAADPALRPARIVASDLARARETAVIIGRATSLEVETDRRLIEIGQGEWEGRTHTELEAEDADRYRAWRDADGVRQPPGGEPIAAATRRVSAFLDEVGAANAGWPLCVVSHGGTLRILASLLLGREGRRLPPVEVDNASVSVISRRGTAWHLERWNDALHLLGHGVTHVDESEGRPLAL